MSLTLLLVLALALLFVFRSSVRAHSRTLTIVGLALVGAALFSVVVGSKMGGFMGLVGLVMAFVVLVPRIRELIDELFPSRTHSRRDDHQ